MLGLVAVHFDPVAGCHIDGATVAAIIAAFVLLPSPFPPPPSLACALRQLRECRPTVHAVPVASERPLDVTKM
jgi:hypothetical protein